MDCPPPSLQIGQFHGTAEHVGSGTNNGQLQLRGEVLGFGGAFNLGASRLGATTLRLTDLLRESLGAGELVRGSFGPLLPLRLTARPGSNATAVLFATPPSVGAPTVRMEFNQRDPRTGTLDFTLKVERAVIAPRLCGNAARGSMKLRTRFSLTDGVHGLVEVSTEQPWQCKGDQLKTP